MSVSPRTRRRLFSRLLAAPAVAIGLFSGASGSAPAAEPDNAPPVLTLQVLAAPGTDAPALDLPGLRRLSLEKQPALIAYRSSLGAAEAKIKALDHIALVGVIRRDLPVRRKQADQGSIAARAQLTKAEYETLYAVTRTYLSILYAEQQLKVADQALDKDDVFSLPYLRNVAAGAERNDVKKWNVEAIDVLILQVKARREEAVQGIQRAKAALREAVGLEVDCPLHLATAEMPTLNPRVERDAIVSLARERRGEIVQAGVGAEVTALEVSAQNRILGLRGETFAMGSDLHALPIPQGIANGEYRPGAVMPEMPSILVGCRKDRASQAEDLHGRAVAVVDKTRHLVVLEAEDTYYKWLLATREAEEYERASKAAKDVADAARGLFKVKQDPPTRPTLEDMLDVRVKATQMRLLANQARFEQLLALAALERVTAGGFSAGFDASPALKK